PGSGAGAVGVLASGNFSAQLASGPRKFHVDLNSLGAGVGHDQLFVVGSVNLGSGLASSTLDINAPATFTANGGHAFVIISNDGASDPVVGQFAGLPHGGTLTINGQQLRISYKGINGLDNNPANDDNDVVLIKNTPAMITDVAITQELN